MASLPPQRVVSQQRPSSSAESPSSQQEQVARTNSFSTQSVDSQTILLNIPSTESSQPVTETAEPVSTQKHVPQDEDDEPRKCWICFNDETEDDETTSEWRSPCACSLVAHEKCLLDWIADMEAPSSRRRAGTRAGKVLCPQCKSEIKIQRPKNYVVEGVRAVERLTGSLLLPSLALVTGTALYSTLTVAGTHTIYQIFGTEDALQILGPLYETPDPRTASLAMQTLQRLRQHWRLDLGLPLIPTILVASRTTFADSFLPFLPLIFFVSSDQPGDELLQLQWPPSAAFAFAALPYIRGFYNAYYDRVWLPREQRWLKEIQPRAGEDTNADAQIQIDEEQVQNNNPADEVVDDIEIEVDFDIFADWNNGGEANNHNAPENPPVPVARGPGRPNAAPQGNEDAIPNPVNMDRAGQDNQQDAAPAPNIPREPAAPPRQRARRERNIAFSTTSLADTILGALIFPSIAAAMGEFLKHALPASWVSPPAGTPATSWLGGWIKASNKPGTVGKPTGFLQTRWGRSIVGGCLFIGFKDAVLLYVRWKMAQNHRRRKILDFDKKTKTNRVGTAAASR